MNVFCHLFCHRWGHWRLCEGMLWVRRDCERCGQFERHSVWECANLGHAHP